MPHLLHETLGYDNIYGQIWIARKKLKNKGHISGGFIPKMSRFRGHFEKKR